MKLIIKRAQMQRPSVRQKNLKDNIFEFSFRVEFTQEERDLISKYNLEQTHLPAIWGSGEGPTVDDLIKGKSWSGFNVADALEAENALKENLKNFKTVLFEMSSYGGEEVIEV